MYSDAAELDDLQPEVGSRNAVSFPNAATQTESIGNKLDEKDEMLSRLMAQHRQLSKFVDSAQHFSERFFKLMLTSVFIRASHLVRS